MSGSITLLVSCGGGGNSSGSPATSTLAASGGAGAAPAAGAGGVINRQNSDVLADVLFGVDLVSVGDTMLGRSGTGGEFSTLVIAPAGNNYSVTCDAGGRYTVSKTRVNPSGNSVGDTATVTIEDCKTTENGVTITENGKVTVKLTKVLGGYVVGADTGALDFEMTFEKVVIDRRGVSSSASTELNGKWSGAVVEDVTTGKVTLSTNAFNVAGTENGKSYQATLRNFSEVFSLNKMTQAYTMDVDFDVDLVSQSNPEINGTYAVVTEPVFAGIADGFGFLDAAPTRGKMTVSGAKGGRVVLEARPGGGLWMSVDENGDGLFEKESMFNWNQIAG